jgi:NAD(P)-dependent dehydrogenase (short-subunit alcohol dehydrogenase family)
VKRGFEGRVALVTGGASGIGRITAEAFAREGAKVLVSTDSNIKGGEDTVEMIKASGGEALFVKCDVSKADDVEATVKAAVDTFGRLDFAFNNAGVGPDGVRMLQTDIVDLSEADWDRTVDVNLKGTFLCMKYEMRQMLRQKYGVIINSSSAGAVKPQARLSAYGASKSGIFGLSKVAALECATSGIRVNVVCPGPTGRTRLMENLTSSDPSKKEMMLDIIAMRRLGEPEDIAQAVIWLCSDAASFITGLIMPVDGGMTLL